MSERTIQARFLDSMPSIRPCGLAKANLVRKATGYEQQKAKAALSGIGFAGCAS
jgi:hypothetical protein